MASSQTIALIAFLSIVGILLLTLLVLVIYTATRDTPSNIPLPPSPDNSSEQSSSVGPPSPPDQYPKCKVTVGYNNAFGTDISQYQDDIIVLSFILPRIAENETFESWDGTSVYYSGGYGGDLTYKKMGVQGIAEARQAGKKIFMAIGGANGWPSSIWKKLLATNAEDTFLKCTAFASSLIEFLKNATYGDFSSPFKLYDEETDDLLIDGIDIDYEDSNGVFFNNNSESYDGVMLVGELSKALKQFTFNFGTKTLLVSHAPQAPYFCRTSSTYACGEGQFGGYLDLINSPNHYDDFIDYYFIQFYNNFDTPQSTRDLMTYLGQTYPYIIQKFLVGFEVSKEEPCALSEVESLIYNPLMSQGETDNFGGFMYWFFQPLSTPDIERWDIQLQSIIPHDNCA